MAVDHDGVRKDFGFFHFVVEVVAFSGPLPYSGKNGVAAVFHGDVADEFLHDDGFADAGATEGSDFAAFGKGGDKINDFDAGF
mgnify:CR=1 FL=1